MSRSRPSSQPVKDLPHPNDPTIIVTVRKPSRVEGIQYNESLSQHQRALVVYDKDGNPAKDEKGNERTFVQQLYPMSSILDSLRVSVVKWSGILDSDDVTPLPLNDENLPVLFEEWLDVRVDETIDGKTITVQKSFSKWISEQVAKPKVFDADPTVKASA